MKKENPSSTSNHAAMSSQHKGFTLRELAEMTGAQFVGEGDYLLTDVADLESATSSDVSFLGNLKYQQAYLDSKAGVVFVDPSTPLEAGRQYLIHPRPSNAFQQVIEAFYAHLHHEVTGFPGIHATAVIHPTAQIEPNVTIGPYAVIEKDVKIGAGSHIGAGCFIGLGVCIGKDCFLHPHVMVRERSIIEDRVVLQPGVVIGSCGFGYTPNAKGEHIKLRQLGYVHIEADVEIGANSTIDRARFKKTWIKKGSKIDNLVQIAHGVIIGEHNIIISQTGIAGSTETGRHVIIGGQAAIDGHLKIADGVMLAARSGVSKSLLTTGKYGGAPIQTLSAFNRNGVFLRNIETYVNQLKDVLKRVERLESNSTLS